MMEEMLDFLSSYKESTHFLAEIPTTPSIFTVHNQNWKHRKTRYFYYLNICDHLLFINSVNQNISHFAVI